MDWNMYDIASDEPDARERAMAMAQALRGKEDFGNILALSGAKSFQPLSQALLGQAQQGNEFLGTAGGNHVKGLRELEKFNREQKIKAEQTGYDRGQDIIKHSEHDAATNAQAAIATATHDLAVASAGRADRADARAETEAAEKAKERAEGKPIEVAEGVKLANALSAFDSLDSVEKAYGKVRGSDLTDPLQSAKNFASYNSTKDALAGAIAAGALPAARETPALMEEFKGAFPGPAASPEVASAYFDNQHAAIVRQIENQLSGLENGNASKKQIAAMRQKLEEAKSLRVQRKSAAPGTQKWIFPDGKTYDIKPEEAEEAQLRKGRPL